MRASTVQLWAHRPPPPTPIKPETLMDLGPLTFHLPRSEVLDHGETLSCNCFQGKVPKCATWGSARVQAPHPHPVGGLYLGVRLERRAEGLLNWPPPAVEPGVAACLHSSATGLTCAAASTPPPTPPVCLPRYLGGGTKCLS